MKTKFNKQKTFLLLILLLLTFCIYSPANAETVNLKLAHFVPTMHVQHREAFVPFVENVERLSNGSVQIKIYPGGQLGNPKNMVNNIKKGITDIGFVIPSYVPGIFSRSGVFEMPFVFNDPEHVTRVMYDLFEDYFAADYEDFKVLWFFSSPLSQVHTVKKPIKAIGDFAGMPIRAGGATETTAFRLLGANTVGMDIKEMSISLQKGVVDGVITPYAALKSHKIFDTVKHITEVNFSGTLMVILMNKNKWNQLPSSAKKVIDQAAGMQMGLIASKAFLNEDIENKNAAIEQGIQIHKLTPAEMDQIRSKMSGIYSSWVESANKNGLQGQKILDAFLASAEANR
ncbi:TRAP transporter substrate-binding protein [bacterium]|nr:TRAP transporter substrate-binding protein [bacterium]